ncbi:ester cyclase [Arthrobacter russicus]|jgi:predicted ester cyclase|uniref:Ester cyclase n=1 Tax=Arthrobacter russicus TaxID=172040 RepID=A0ABU1JBA8_9MICC|nr:ester cyclase [Arthrobacter russicus]MDN5666905.1 ester cyclase [Renibacterium salmoninarum]MDR6269705.1 putative ester cyclase [Arthrobacter russicus]
MPLDPVAYHPYQNPDDFIREVTDLIWVERQIGFIRENYEPNSIVHGSYGTSTSRQEVIEGCLMRISDAPEHIGQAGDVVWEARGNDAFLSSHLVLSGETGYKVVGKTIANCLYRRGRMVEEWVVRDELAQTLALGLDPSEVARTKSFRGYTGSFAQPGPVDVIAAGDSGPRPDDYRREVEIVLAMIQQVWNDRDLKQVDEFFLRDLTLHTIGNELVIRPEGYRRRLLHFLDAFPSGQFEVRDIQTQDAVRYGGLRIAVTWKFTGAYNGRARFGATTGSPVEILGISQFLFHDGRISREIKLWDDIAVRAQINAARGDGPEPNANIY